MPSQRPSAPGEPTAEIIAPAAPSAMPQTRALGRAALAAVFYLAIAGALAWYLSRIDYESLARLDIGVGYLVAALFVGCAQRFLLPVVWALMLRSMGHAVRHYPTYNAVYAKGWVGRYLPGKVSMVAVRVYLADTLGAPRMVIGVAGVAEIGMQMLVALGAGLVGIAFLPTAEPELEELRPVAWAAVAILGFVLWPKVFNAVVRVGMRVLRRPVEGLPAVGTRTLVSAGIGYGGASIGMGLHALLVAAAIDPIVLDYPVFIWGAIHLAGALGMLVLIAPGGLGAREGVYLVLLSAVLTPEAALGVVVLSRLMDIAVDVGFYALSMLWERLSRSRVPVSSV